MRKRDRKEFARYVRWCADEMGLRDWCIDVSFSEPPDDEEAGADILCTRGRKHARIRLCEEFRDLEPEQQRHYIVHELLHPHFDPIDTLVEDDLSGIVGRPAWDLFSTSHNRAIEFAVDGIAYVIAQHMPLIEWPD